MRSMNNSINWTALLKRQLESISLGVVGIAIRYRLEGLGF